MTLKRPNIVFLASAFVLLAIASSFAQPSQNLPNPYRWIADWARVPGGGGLKGSIYAPGIDSHGNVWVLTRCSKTNCVETDLPALLEFDSSGRYIKSIGSGIFAFPHGLFIDKDDNLWVTDSGALKGKGNQVTKLSPDGKVLLQLGKPGVMGGSPDNFMGASAVIVAPNGDIFVADGHAALPTGGGASLGFSGGDPSHVRIVKFSKDGKFIKSWGKLGTGPGEFNTPHGLALDSQGRLFVADRGNNRIQVFDQDGKFIADWRQFGKPVSVYIDKHDNLYAIDSDSISGLSDLKYSTIGDPCSDCLVRVPRLTDVGADNPDYTQGIRIGSAKDGVVREFIPAISGPEGPITLPEYLAVDAVSNIYVAEARTQSLKKYIRNVQLPDGAGKEQAQRACSLCHDFNSFKDVNFDHDDWLAVVKLMVRGGAPLKSDEIPIVSDYLAANFKGASTQGVSVPGPVQVTISQWDVPHANSMPYGIYFSKVNGRAWYTSPFSNSIGSFDPRTQQFKEYHLRPGTNPTTLIEWPSANFQGVTFFAPGVADYVGEFHPVDGPYSHWHEGDVLLHPTSSPKLNFHQIAVSRFPHQFWFTVAEGTGPTSTEGSKIGSVRPWSFQVRLADKPTVNSNPYALAVNSEDVPYFTEVNVAKIGSVNPDTMQVTEFALPDPDSVPRGIAISNDDVVWYTDYSRGYLARFDPKTAKFSEWKSPSGASSRPFGITAIGNIVWYAETGTKPNMLVRFDPETEKFQSWPIKDGGSIRQMFAAADGSLWFTRPFANGISHVTIREQ